MYKKKITSTVLTSGDGGQKTKLDVFSFIQDCDMVKEDATPSINSNNINRLYNSILHCEYSS